MTNLYVKANYHESDVCRKSPCGSLSVNWNVWLRRVIYLSFKVFLFAYEFLTRMENIKWRKKWAHCTLETEGKYRRLIVPDVEPLSKEGQNLDNSERNSESLVLSHTRQSVPNAQYWISISTHIYNLWLWPRWSRIILGVDTRFFI